MEYENGLCRVRGVPFLKVSGNPFYKVGTVRYFVSGFAFYTASTEEYAFLCRLAQTLEKESALADCAAHVGNNFVKELGPVNWVQL